MKLRPRPWLERYERQNLKGVEDLNLPQRFYDKAAKVAKPWEKYDLMLQYRYGRICKFDLWACANQSSQSFVINANDLIAGRPFLPRNRSKSTRNCTRTWTLYSNHDGTNTERKMSEEFILRPIVCLNKRVNPPVR